MNFWAHYRIHGTELPRLWELERESEIRGEFQHHHHHHLKFHECTDDSQISPQGKINNGDSITTCLPLTENPDRKWEFHEDSEGSTTSFRFSCLARVETGVSRGILGISRKTKMAATSPHHIVPTHPHNFRLLCAHLHAPGQFVNDFAFYRRSGTYLVPICATELPIWQNFSVFRSLDGDCSVSLQRKTRNTLTGYMYTHTNLASLTNTGALPALLTFSLFSVRHSTKNDKT